MGMKGVFCGGLNLESLEQRVVMSDGISTTASRSGSLTRFSRSHTANQKRTHKTIICFGGGLDACNDLGAVTL